MLRRILFAVRSRIPDPVEALASWKLSVVLTVSGALFFALLAIWATASPPQVVQQIAGLLPFWILYGLLLLNTVLCLWRRWPLLVRSLPAGNWRPLGTFLFHGSFFLLGLAVGLTLLFRQDLTVRVAEGETFSGSPDQIVVHHRARLNPPADPLVFTVDQLRPEFWKDQLLFTRLEADLRFPGSAPKTTRINRPLWIGASTFLRLSGFGYTPRYELRDASGRVLESLWVKLTVFPPGARDAFSFERFPHTIGVEITPDAAIENGRLISRSLNLSHPILSTNVSRGKLTLAAADVEPGEPVEFEGLSLVFPEIRYWGDFSIVRDPGIPVLLTAFLVGLAGLAVRFWPRSAR